MARPLRRGLIAAALAAGGCRLLGGEGLRVPLLEGDAPARFAFDRARGNLAAGRTEEALLDLRQLRVEFPEEAAIRRALQEALLAAGRLEEARAEARADVERDATPLHMVLEARVAATAEEAESLLRRAQEVDRSDPGVRHGLARGRLARAREAGAEVSEAERRELQEDGRREIEELVRDAPGYLPARADRAALFVRTGDRAAAIRELEAILSSDPGDESSRLALGLLLLEEDRAPEAEREFLRLLEARPGNAPALSGRAAAALAQGRAPDALGAIERALAIDPGDPRALFSLGILRRDALEDPEGAAEAFRALLASSRSSRTLSLLEGMRVRFLLDRIEKEAAAASATRPAG